MISSEYNEDQIAKFPATRYMGSKRKLLSQIWDIVSRYDVDTVQDLFAGSNVVSYMLKSQGKRVISNDYMYFSASTAKALIENRHTLLSGDQVESLICKKFPNDGFVESVFDGLYFSAEDNKFIDSVRAGIELELDDDYQKSIAMSALVRACMKKRPRGIFTYTGMRYDDGRRDLKLTLKEHFVEAVSSINAAVFDGGSACVSMREDAMNVPPVRDSLVYIDPPYYSKRSDNDYIRRYHFVEGLARGWEGVEIQEHTKTKKFKTYHTPFSSRDGAKSAFDQLFHNHRDSVLVVSYSSNSLPTAEEMVDLMRSYKSNVDVVPIRYRYSFGNQGFRVSDNRNSALEYLFIGSD